MNNECSFCGGTATSHAWISCKELRNVREQLAEAQATIERVNRLVVKAENQEVRWIELHQVQLALSKTETP